MTQSATSAQVAEVADGVIAVIGGAGIGGRSNSAVILSEGSAAVVDTMLLPVMAGAILDAISGRGAEPRLVVNTHSHTDHVGGNAAFPGVPVVAHPVTATLTAQLAADTSFLGRLFPEFAAELDELRIRVPTAITPGDITAAPGACWLSFGPAHSRSDVAIWLPQCRVLITGDLCFNQVTPLALPRHADIANWIAVLDQLAAFQPQVVIPGHGPVGGPEALTATRAYLSALLSAAGDVAAGRLDTERAIAGFDLGETAGWTEPGRTRLNLSVAIAELGGGAADLPPGVPAPVPVAAEHVLAAGNAATVAGADGILVDVHPEPAELRAQRPVAPGQADTTQTEDRRDTGHRPVTI